MESESHFCSTPNENADDSPKVRANIVGEFDVSAPPYANPRPCAPLPSYAEGLWITDANETQSHGKLTIVLLDPCLLSISC